MCVCVGGGGGGGVIYAISFFLVAPRNKEKSFIK